MVAHVADPVGNQDGQQAFAADDRPDERGRRGVTGEKHGKDRDDERLGRVGSHRTDGQPVLSEPNRSRLLQTLLISSCFPSVFSTNSRVDARAGGPELW